MWSELSVRSKCRIYFIFLKLYNFKLTTQNFNYFSPPRLTSIKFVLNLLQAESFGFHHNKQSENEANATENAKQPKSSVTSNRDF